MTILHVTDLHFDKRWFHWLSASAPHHDLLVISGDLLDLTHPVYPTKQIQWVTDWVRDFGNPLCLCSGNHDLLWDDRAERWRPADWLRDLASDSVVVDGQHREVAGLVVAAHGPDCAEAHAADVWAIHAAPSGLAVSQSAGEKDRGDPDSLVWRATTPPTLVLSGHVHRPMHWHDSARGVRFVNPGHNRHGRFPNHVLIDPELGTLIHVSDSATGPRCAAGQFRALSSPARAY